MSNRKQRDQNHATADLFKTLHASVCPNCGKPGSHFCPPCFGEPGFFACDMINKLKDKHHE